jgi:hypothetical protein
LLGSCWVCTNGIGGKCVTKCTHPKGFKANRAYDNSSPVIASPNQKKELFLQLKIITLIYLLKYLHMLHLLKSNPSRTRHHAVLSLSILYFLVCHALSAQTQNCVYRPTRLTATDPLCQKLTTLATRTNKAANVTKLANASKVSNLSLDSIVTEMNLWVTDSNRIVFLDDIMDVATPSHLGNHIDSINVRMVRGWKMIYDSISSKTIFKKDIQVLRAIDTILMTPTKWAAFTRNGNNIGFFLAKYKETRCSISGNVGLGGVPMMHEVLRNTALIFERHQLTPGYLSFHDREVLASNNAK